MTSKFLFAICLTLALSTFAYPYDLSKQERTRKHRVEHEILPAVSVAGRLGTREHISSRLQTYGVPAISIAVIDEGKIAWADAYGVKDNRSDSPASSQTLFLAGSISKPIAALGALKLVDENRLTLDSDVSSSLRSWKLPASDFTKAEAVTLRRLLSHTAGINVHGFGGYSRNEPVPSLLQVLNGSAPANSPPIVVESTPGGEYRYSGGGYTVVQLLISDVSGQPFERFMHSSVFTRIGMHDSTFSQPLPQSQQTKAAHGHFGGGEEIAGGFRVYPEMAAAGLWTTPTDLAKYAIHTQESFAGRGTTLLGKELATEMLSRQVGGHGLGPEITGDGATLRFGHDGVDAGFDSRLVAYASTGQGAVVMTNSNFSHRLMSEVLDSIARIYEWPGHEFQGQHQISAMPSHALDSAVGEFTLPDGESVRVRSRGNRLFMHWSDAGEVEIFASPDPNIFVAPQFVTPRLRFERDDQGRVHRIIGGAKEQTVFTRVKKAGS